jgi:hypothetical protein
VTTFEKTEHCSKCDVGIQVEGSEEWRVCNAASDFRAQHRHNTIVWVCYQHDMGVKIDALFDNELDALRHAVGTGYLKVAPVESGEIGNLP